MPVKYMDIKEFRETGYLQELNRRFLHPLGLAMEVVIEDDGTERIGGIWDYRDDPEGILFGEDTIDRVKAGMIDQIIKQRVEPRQTRLGYWVQPVESDTAVDPQVEQEPRG